MPIEQAEFGRTGHQSSRVIFGGAALAQVSQRVADQTLDLLLAHGVNHLDVASSYGEAEVRIRPWLQREPGRFFLATKGDERTAAGAREELHRSLDRMGVDHVRPLATARPGRSDRVGHCPEPWRGARGRP